MGPSEITQLARDYENYIKEIKENMFRIGWHMRGSIDYDTLFNVLTTDDRQVLNDIIKDQIERTNKTGLNLL